MGAGVTRGQGEKPVRRRVRAALALQGGGAHGAFTWGVLDALLRADRFDITALSGASAGAMNAAALASGYVNADPARKAAAARAALEAFWRGVSKSSEAFNPNSDRWKSVIGDIGAGAIAAWMEAMARVTSPYDRNPLDLNPLRGLLREQIDFDGLRRQTAVKLYISATNVRTGALKLFTEDEISDAVLLASACLPAVFQAVEIDGEIYWDGGYSANPPLTPLLNDPGGAKDVILVHVNPLHRAATPTTADQIVDRLNEITFNTPLLAELRVLARDQARRRSGVWLRRGKGPVRLHAIQADAALSDLSPSSKHNTDWAFLQELRDRGRAAAELWLETDGAALGRRDGVDLATFAGAEQ